VATPSMYIDETILKRPTSYKGLTIFPINLVSNAFERSDEDLSTTGAGRVGEGVYIKETGYMDKVEVINRNDRRLVVMDGTTIKGGAANRMILASAVLSKNEQAELPACTVENRRWECITTPTGKVHIKTKDTGFDKSEFGVGSLRRMKHLESMHFLNKRGEMEIRQEEVWNHIQDRLRKISVASRKFDMHDMYTHTAFMIDEYLPRFFIDDLQVGFVTHVGQDRWFVDVFLNHMLLKKAFKALVKSYIMDVIVWRHIRKDDAAISKVPEAMQAKDVISWLAFSKMKPFSMPGIKKDGNYFFNSNHICGNALIEDNNLIYLNACTKAGP